MTVNRLRLLVYAGWAVSVAGLGAIMTAAS